MLWQVLSNEKLALFLQLAPLNGELFTPQSLDAFTLTNRDLLSAFWFLAWYQDNATSPPRRVNYAALDVEELGSVYESLLEFHPAVDHDAAGRPEFKLLAGSERKTTGSYYTPPELVNELIQSALEPVMRDRLATRPDEPEKALLVIRVCDPACGSGHFLLAAARRLGKELARRQEGSVFVSPYDSYLPLYEAKMLHQFDHRWATYEERESRRTGDWETEARDVRPQEKRNPAFMVQPRYWVREEVVKSAMPKYPEPLAIALQVEHRPSMQYVLALWGAGFYLQCGDNKQAATLLHTMISSDLDRTVARTLGVGTDEIRAQRLAQDFPLTKADVEAIAACLETPESLARDLVERFSPRWFLGWRDICRSTDERTLIASALPRVAVGNNCPLFFMGGIRAPHRLSFEAMANSLVVDYITRQKVGGTHINYFYLKQFPTLFPTTFDMSAPFSSDDTVAYILDQFPIVRQKDEQVHGSYRTRERILAIYDAMLTAQRSGHPYQTTLHPPPRSP